MDCEETLVRSACPVCGTVDLPATAVTVYLTSGEPRYRFVCPTCYGQVEKATTARAVNMLRGAGAAVRTVPAEVVEQPLAGPDIDLDEVLAFSRALAGVDDVAGAAQRG